MAGKNWDSQTNAWCFNADSHFMDDDHHPQYVKDDITPRANYHPTDFLEFVHIKPGCTVQALQCPI